MNKYELALVVNARIDDEARAAVVDKAKGYITRFGGQLGDTEEWGKRKLAYEIQKMNEAYYYFIQFEADSDCPNELEKRMRIMDNVLRYLVVRKDENDTFKVAPDKVYEEPKAADEAAESAVAETAETAAAETAENAAAETAAADTAEAAAEAAPEAEKAESAVTE
mgnify:CR=1 FL=1